MLGTRARVLFGRRWRARRRGPSDSVAVAGRSSGSGSRAGSSADDFTADWALVTTGHRFVDDALLRHAMSHRSWCAENPGQPSNERLEFLGDAILQWVITELVFHAHPDLEEGPLTDLRKSLVNAETLARVALDIDLGPHIRLGVGEADAGGRLKVSILADTLEAFIGALYLDGGAEAARVFVRGLLAERMGESLDRLHVFDARSHLIRICVRENGRPPLFEISATGAAHEPVFTAAVIVDDQVVARESGRSKKAAAQNASVAALEVLAARGVDTGRA
ncbi:MAG: ribonuclease III [Ilumatobacteraceae bacterium]